ncbi:LPxTG domain-containing protein [Corynebacterium kutscheri]|uniref:LPxTG domain-containing protein n=1 Tax=Corynebacterium kutscheri TaxID=35755 RepID=A0AB38VVW1_9CORY|nr:DUF5979 domain-containing protein [Corynebacterium kutscheri]VEH06222.1 LPxTG domain-containing protein [Corynebacterium kutscheri]VEH82138.1 LPxTG domain-containing protein [Corynebacterium kutscheri]
MNQVGFSAAQKRVGKRLVVLTSAVSLSASLLTAVGTQQAAYAEETALISQGGVTEILEADDIAQYQANSADGVISMNESFTLKKVVVGAPRQDLEFRFDIECGADNQARKTQSVAIKNGEEKKVDNLPAGLACSLTERSDSAKVADYNRKLEWEITYQDAKTPSRKGDSSVVAEFRPDMITSITATSTYTKIGEKAPAPQPDKNNSGFRVKKVLAGDKEATVKLKDEKFKFDWTCAPKADASGKKLSGSVELKGNEVKEVMNIPEGSTCTIEEKNPKKLDGYTHTLDWEVRTLNAKGHIDVKSGPKIADEFVVGAADKTRAEITATNRYTKDNNKGSSGFGILGIILAIIAAGGLGYLFTMIKQYFRW